MGKEHYFLSPAPDLANLQNTHKCHGLAFSEFRGISLKCRHVGPVSISLREIPGSRFNSGAYLASLRTAAPNNKIHASVALVLLTELQVVAHIYIYIYIMVTKDPKCHIPAATSPAYLGDSARPRRCP